MSKKKKKKKIQKYKNIHLIHIKSYKKPKYQNIKHKIKNKITRKKKI